MLDVHVILFCLVLVSLLVINKDTAGPPFSVDVRMAITRRPEQHASYAQILLSSALLSLFG